MSSAKGSTVNGRQGTGPHREGFRLTKAICEDIDVDDVWNHIGRFGKYQLVQMIFLTVACLGFSPAVLSNVFVGKAVEHHCSHSNQSQKQALPGNTTIKMTSCTVQTLANQSTIVSEEACHEFEYDTDIHVSFVSEWDTVCDQSTLSRMPQTMVMIGMAVGAFLLPPLGDRYGRKFQTCASQALMCITMVAMAFVPSIKIFMFLSFMAGFFNQGFMVGVSILMIELFTTELRGNLGIYAIVLWVVSVITLIPFAYAMRNLEWRMLQMAFGLISAPIFILYWCIDDSLRWMVANAKVDHAQKLLGKACRMNNKKLEGLFTSVLLSRHQKTLPAHQGNEKEEAVELVSPAADEDVRVKVIQASESSITALWKNRSMLKILLVLCFSWMINSQIYYGITLLSTTLAGNPFLNFFIAAALELPSTFISLFTLRRFGRKKTIITFISFAGMSLLAAVLLQTLAPKTPTIASLNTALTLFGKFHVSGSFNALWIYTPELFPTNLRNKGVGLASMCARIGAIASPFFHLLSSQAKWAPGVIFSVGAFVCAFLLTLVPETRWRELPDSIAEIETWLDEDRRGSDKQNL